MKCIQMNDGKIYRTIDKKAKALVDGKQAVYINKSEWKKTGREYLTRKEVTDGT